ncbi:hypothetical protein MPSEU_000840600 [Mayamaea pseudoterrestris]|nr:hypothetical protein MPSEU_000840600 [Mayamaea pseudoterrestris]
MLLHYIYQQLCLLLLLSSLYRVDGFYFSWRQDLRPSKSSLNVTPRAASPARTIVCTQVISDVDDTLKSSGGVQVAGVALGGIDVQYDRGQVYPGVAEFMLQLSLGVNAASPTALSPPKVAILTARAEEFKGALKLKDSSSVAQAFVKAGQAAGVDNWGLGPVLYGSVAEWIVQDRKGLRKFSNFERLLEQDPTGSIMQYVYVGDTGELDQEAGETMLREYPELVMAVFLHYVKDQPGAAAATEVPAPKLINGRPIIFFRTYVGAAVAAVQLGLISLDGLESVMEAAVSKLAGVNQTSDKWIDLNRDLERAARLLGT